MAYIKEITLPNGDSYDIKGDVEQAATTDENWRNILLSDGYNSTADATITDGAGATKEVEGITVQPSTGTVRSPKYNVNSKCTIQWNATNNSVEFVFV